MTIDTTRRTTVTRRRLLRTGATLSGAALLGIGATTGAAGAPGKPEFSPRVWRDGDQWGTKVTGLIKHPNEESLDKFFVITNPVTGELPEGTLPVSDVAPGNPAYNGGR